MKRGNIKGLFDEIIKKTFDNQSYRNFVPKAMLLPCKSYAFGAQKHSYWTLKA